MTIAKCHCRPILKSKGKQYTFVSDHPEEERTVYLDDLPRDEFGSIVLPNEPWDGGDSTMSAGWVVIDSGDASDLEVDLDSDEGETVQ